LTLLLSAFLLGLMIAPAHADTSPMILPDRDVDVAYQLSTPGRPDQSYRLEYDANGERARIENPGEGTYFLVDLPTGKAEMVVPQLSSVVDAPDVSGLTRQITDAGHYARFTPLGEAHYAGLACQNWLVKSAQGTARACLTPDGVILHFNGSNAHGSGSVTATSVRFASAPATEFVVPPDFHAVTLPPAILRQLLGGGSL
jgi:hypothetical protein